MLALARDIDVVQFVAMKEKLIVALLFGVMGFFTLAWLIFLAYEGWETLAALLSGYT